MTSALSRLISREGAAEADGFPPEMLFDQWRLQVLDLKPGT
jgi:hypothetical protein